MRVVILPVSNDYCKPLINDLEARKGKDGFVSSGWTVAAFIAQDNEGFFSPFRKSKFGGGQRCI